MASEQAVAKCSVRMFWFLSVSSGSDQEYWDYVKVAVLSAKKASPNLVPVLLFASSTTPDPAELPANLQWFKHRGIVYHHNLTFASDMQAAVDNNRATLGATLSDADWIARLEGIYMRMDIPLVVPLLLKQLEQLHPGSTASINKATALYTDADVMFYHAFNPCLMPQPRIMAIGPESGQYQEGSDWHAADWNSGVLFINLKGLQAEWPSMLDFARKQKWVFPVFDQSLISQYFAGERAQALDQLPNAYNWKGYWGCSPEIVITHWHGPKPSGEDCIGCYVQQRAEQNPSDVSACKCREIYDTLWSFAVGADGGSLYSKMYKDYTSFMAKARQSTIVTGNTG